MSPPTPLLEVRNLCKKFPGVVALDHVNLHLAVGEVLAVVGENGAGKSTLMKILAGNYTPDAGDILLKGQPLRMKNVRAALDYGIVLIHQELNLASNLSVAANLFLGREIARWGLLDEKTMADSAHAALRRVGLDIEPHRKVGELSIGQQQLVEICRALQQSARILIMDEPTSSLSQRETETLFRVISSLKSSGVAILYISHRLAEVRVVADRVTVLRDGKNAGELQLDAISHDSLVRLMIGRDIQLNQRRSICDPGRVVLDVRQLRHGHSPSVALAIRAGEIVGLAGLVGAGRTELAEALFGIRRIIAGEVLLEGEPFQPASPRQSIDRGVLLAPEDRRLHGLVLEQTVRDNIGLTNFDRASRIGLISESKLTALANRCTNQLRIKSPSINQQVGLLSGGNQQKVVFGKWLERGPKVLILDEPTRGVDIGARQEIYELMRAWADQGVAILMISSDMEEILTLSDRVLVMCQGEITGELSRDEASEEAVMRLATSRGAGQCDDVLASC